MNGRIWLLVAPMVAIGLGCGEREQKVDDSPEAEKLFQKELEENRSAEGAAYSQQKKQVKGKPSDD